MSGGGAATIERSKPTASSHEPLASAIPSALGSALAAKCPHVREVRVKGAMIGVQLAIDGTPVVSECLKRKLLINCTHGTVIRLLPALNIADKQIDEGCSILEEVLLALK